jgi:hypothetical protein
MTMLPLDGIDLDRYLMASLDLVSIFAWSSCDTGRKGVPLICALEREAD